MNARQLLGLTAALVVVVPSLALADSVQYQDEATNFEVVQQHSVFVEIFIVKENNVTERHPFGAIVGLIKECQIERRNFDNAVLWFNDQFLFGEKVNVTVIDSSKTILGEDNRTNAADSVNGKFVREDGETHRYDTQEEYIPDGIPGQCGEVTDGRWESVRLATFIPDMWVAAKPVEDPDVVGSVGETVSCAGNDSETETPPYNSCNFDKSTLNTLITLDNACLGCVFDYISTFYVTDPNGINWWIDKFAYPICIVNPGFALGGEGPVGDVAGENIGNSCGSRHADVGDDYVNPTVVDPVDDDAQNHCYNSDTASDTAASDQCTYDGGNEGPGGSMAVTKEPLWVTHLAVDPVDRMGFRDEALWQSTSGLQRNGAPRYDFGDDNSASDSTDHVQDGAAGGACDSTSTDIRCALEYDFLLVIDFASVDPNPTGMGLACASENGPWTGGDLNTVDANWNDCVDPSADGNGPEEGFEYSADCKEHGEGGADENDSYLAGNSHPHNPSGEVDPATGLPYPEPVHQHDCVYVDVLPLDSVPYMSQAFSVWYGCTDNTDCENTVTRAPIPLNEDCDAVDATLAGGFYESTVNGVTVYWPAADIDAALEARGIAPGDNTVSVCDVDSDDGEYHLHDGSQTPFTEVPE